MVREISDGDSTTCSSARIKSELHLHLEEVHRKVAQASVKELVNYATEQTGWDVVEEKDNMVIEKKEGADGAKSVVGRVTLQWDLAKESEDINMDTIADFLWDEDSKKLYDDNTIGTLVTLEHTEDFHVITQLFNGRFGFSGRDFLIVCCRHRETLPDGTDRFVLGAKNVPDESAVEEVMLPQIKDQYFKYKKKHVRGFVQAAGFVVEQKAGDSVLTLKYIYDANVATKGIPSWIVNRVKLDQLKTVRNIPPRLRERVANLKEFGDLERPVKQ